MFTHIHCAINASHWTDGRHACVKHAVSLQSCLLYHDNLVTHCCIHNTPIGSSVWYYVIGYRNPHEPHTCVWCSIKDTYAATFFFTRRLFVFGRRLYFLRGDFLFLDGDFFFYAATFCFWTATFCFWTATFFLHGDFLFLDGDFFFLRGDFLFLDGDFLFLRGDFFWGLWVFRDSCTHAHALIIVATLVPDQRDNILIIKCLVRHSWHQCVL